MRAVPGVVAMVLDVCVRKKIVITYMSVLVQVVARVKPIGEDVADHLRRQARLVSSDE